MTVAIIIKSGVALHCLLVPMNLYQVKLRGPYLTMQNNPPGQFETDAMEEEEHQHASLVILYEAMVQLTVEPGRFDSIARRLTEDLNMVLEGGICQFEHT